VADWVDANGGRAATALTPEAVYAVRDEELATTARALYRTLPDGRFVAVADAARRELATGEAFAAS
jgi:hypothetical protein